MSAEQAPSFIPGFIKHHELLVEIFPPEKQL